MKKNVGSIDKVIRIIIAIVAAYFAYEQQFSTTVTYILWAVAAIMVLTTLISRCPLYCAFGASTCKVKKED